MTPLATRRQRELALKLDSLDRELDAWQQRTMVAPMRRHFSQVRRIRETLDGLLDSMKRSTGWNAPTEDVVLTKAVAWERRILTAYAIWEVFRGKLAQRDDPLFRDRLMACDDLAWACYEPAMKRFSAATREPPLVYLNSTWSAFLRRRDVSIEKDIEPGKDARDVLEEQDYRDTIKRLPIPLLGLPWFQVAHLPSSLLVAHEIGHAVEFDFDLTSKIDAALAAAGLAFEADWRASASEVFADLYGCLCLGEYFAATLLDLLVADKAAVAAEVDFGAYPTRGYRVELAVRALEFLGRHDAANGIRQTWETVYGPLAPLMTRGGDPEKVVAAIYGPAGLDVGSVIQPPAANIAALAQTAGLGNKATLATEGDARALFCALRHAYDQGNPTQFTRASDLLIAQVLAKYAGVFRFRGLAVSTQSQAETHAADQASADRANGRALAKSLGLDEDEE